MAQEVFVAELAEMYLNGDVAGQLAIELLIHFNDLFRGDRFCKINLGFHENSSLEFVMCGCDSAYISITLKVCFKSICVLANFALVNLVCLPDLQAECSKSLFFRNFLR